jgi:hypothetical protein
MCNLDLPCEIVNNWFRLQVRLNTCEKRVLALLCPSVIRTLWTKNFKIYDIFNKYAT